MKIPKEFYRSLAEIKATLPKLVDHTVMVVFVKENEAKFFSEGGKDRETYFVSRQEDESETNFHRRAEQEACKRFPKSQMTVVSHAAYLEVVSEIGVDDKLITNDEPKTSQRYSEKIRKKY